jgi:hypothetical protein
MIAGGIARRDFMNLKLIVATFVITALPLCVQAQPSTATVTKAEVQKVVTMISGDTTKIEIYCDIAKLGAQIDEAEEKKDTKKTDELSQKMDELAKQLGPEYIALMEGLQGIDPESQDGREIGSTFAGLNELCAK